MSGIAHIYQSHGKREKLKVENDYEAGALFQIMKY